MNNRPEIVSLFGKIGFIRQWPNNPRIGRYWLPDVKDTVEIKATVEFVGLLLAIGKSL